MVWLMELLTYMLVILDGMDASCSNVDIGSYPLTMNCRNIYTVLLFNVVSIHFRLPSAKLREHMLKHLRRRNTLG